MQFWARTVILMTCGGLGAVSAAQAQIPNATTQDSVARRLAELSARVDSLQATLQGRAATPAATADTSSNLEDLRAAAEAAAGGPPDTTAAAKPTATPQRTLSALNPEISVTGDIRVLAREGRQRDNAVPREFEFAFQSALDPYSSTKVFVTFEDEELGIEEGYVYWTGLPGRLRVDLGKFRQQIGDLNRWHLHALPEPEYPLVYQRFLSEEGLAGIGVSLYTTLPVAVAGGTHEIWLQGTTAESDPLLAGSREPTLLVRLQNFWQLSPSTYTQIGFTGLGGNNADADLRSRLVGLDFRFTWRPPEAGTRRDVTFRAEGYRLHATETGIATNRYGGFVDLQARTSRRWVLATRYDHVEAPRGVTNTEWRITPSITWWQSEFVYLRLAGEHRKSDFEGTNNALTLQAVWAMGPHKHETY